MRKTILVAVSFFAINLTQLLSAQQVTFNKVIDHAPKASVAYSVVNTFDKKYMIAGQIDYSGLVVKLDSLGNILWDKNFGDELFISFNHIIATRDSCYVLVGQYKKDILCVKLNENGDTIWTNVIDVFNDESATYVQQTSDNGFIIIGGTNSCTEMSSHMVVVKLDAEGNIIWSEILIGYNVPDHAHSIKETPNGDFLMTGFMTDSLLLGGAFLMKLDSAGNILWTKKYYITFGSYCEGSDLLITNDGILIYVADYDYGLVIMKTDFVGNISWAKSYGIMAHYHSEQAAPKMHTTSDNCYVLVNDQGINYSTLLKIDSVGNPVWAKDLLLDAIEAIEAPDSGLFIVGYGPVIGLKSAPSSNPQIGVIKTDYSGNSIDCVSPSHYNSQSVYVYKDQVSFVNIYAGTQVSERPIISDLALIIDNGCVGYLEAINENSTAKSNMVIYPNPTEGRITIENLSKNSNTRGFITIFNIHGQMLLTESLQEYSTEIDLSLLPQGVYTVHITNNDGTVQIKLIKQ